VEKNSKNFSINKQKLSPNDFGQEHELAELLRAAHLLPYYWLHLWVDDL
jgi:hypothetical protein